ncbi:ATP-binding protein [Seohaeicola zhoushanensis]|nr:ATP-binding protein [Seohaeicola zhoushanensis]
MQRSPLDAPSQAARPQVRVTKTGARTLAWETLRPAGSGTGWRARLATLKELPKRLVALPIDVEIVADGARLDMEEPPGAPLATMIERGGFNLGLFLTLATQMAEALQALHGRQIAHGHLSPAAIFVQPTTRAVRIALHPECLFQAAARPSGIEGRDLAAIAYCAPEQSGRTSETADLRADLYALGVIFYEMLAGIAPFRAIDELELVHRHLAVPPQPLADLRPDLPHMVVAIVHKLLEKSPSNRYQSAYGLLSDLRLCKEAERRDGTVSDFPLGARDALSTFVIPDRLYGRDTERRVLEEALSNVRAGGVEVVLLGGRSGTGKSALAAELRDMAGPGARPQFVSGKYEEVQQLPYLALLEALREFVMRKVVQGGAGQQRYRDRLVERLGDNLAIVAEFLPELKHLVENIPPDTARDPLERNQRFRIAMQGFFEVMAEADAPVILFLDDLQWADAASIALIEDVFLTARLSSLMVIAAYRDNAGGAVERVKLFSDALVASGVTPRNITVRSLGVEDTTQMIADAMHLGDRSQISELARIVHAKTQGNAFYLRKMLNALYQEGAIRFDIDAETWRWALDEVTRRVVDTDVALLMTERIERLSPQAQHTLRCAACFGTNFTASSLQIVSDLSVQEIERNLKEAGDEGFVLRLGGSDGSLHAFSHDMVRDAAYRATPEPERARLHYRIGAFLAEDIANPATDDRLFSALDQILLGIDLLKEPPVGRRLVQFALAAVTRTKSVAAYENALRYLRAVESLPVSLGGADWETEPEITARLRLETMEVLFFISGFEVAEPYFRELLENLPSARTKAHVFQVLVTLFTFRSEYERALEFGIEGLKLLGVNLSPPLAPKIMAQLARTQIEVRRQDVFDFSSLPAMRNEESEQLIEMLMIVATPAFLQNKDLFVLISLRMFRVTLRDGMTSAGLFSVQTYAIVNYLAFKAVDRAFRIGTNLFPLLEARNISAQVRGRLYYTYSVVIAWHFRRYEDLHDLLREGIKHSWTAADLEYVGYFYYGMLKYSWVGCASLGTLVGELDEFERYQKRLNHEVLNNITAIYRRAVERLTQPGDGHRWSEADRKLDQTMRGEASVGSFLTAELLLTHIYSDWSVVRQLYERLWKEQSFTTLGPEFVDFHLLSGLCLTRPPPNTLQLARLTRRRRLRKHLAALKRLADHFPVNHQFQYTLLQAEVARGAGRTDKALTLFGEAIRKAEDTQTWSYVGIACECAARAAEQSGDTGRRDGFLERAVTAYAKWGATRKVAALEAEWPEVFNRQGRAASPVAGEGLDLATIIKTSQAILEITDLDTMLQHLLEIAMENAGADVGKLYLMRDEALQLVAEASITRRDLRVKLLEKGLTLDRLPSDEYPRELISRVAVSHEALILGDAVRGRGFEDDTYVRARAPQSLMCLPIVSSGSLKGVLQLENTLSRGVFTAGREEVLTTIMSLAAISLTNALLYARQEETLEIETRARQELTRVNKLKDEFLANTSHELRTPLNGIIGLADSMIGGANGPLAPAAMNTLGLIVSSGRRLSNLVNDILDFSRLKDGEIELQLKPVDLHTIVSLVFALIELRATGSGVKLVNDIPRNAPSVLADEARLQQILLNLVDNGVKFGAGGEVRVSLEVEGERARVTVADQGDGIPAEAQEVIFQSFEQADASIQRTYGGMGLGLAITRSLVELHGGTISVASELGQGARFTFDLQITRAAASRLNDRIVAQVEHSREFQGSVPPIGEVAEEPAMFHSGPSSADVDGGQNAAAGEAAYKVLVVDDDPVNLQVLKNYMRLEGFEVVLASDGENALRLVSDGYEADIVLLDVMMPRMSGYEVCARLRETYPAARLPIVMLTAKNRVEDLQAGFNVGATDYLTKPFSRQELSARMHSHIELTRVSTAYERFVPVEFLDFLKRDSIVDIHLGDNVERQMTVMFTDIRGYTSIAEQASPAESFQFLATYFARIGPIIQESGGVVNNYLGDGVMALFPGDPGDAVKAAIGIQRELRRLNIDRAALGKSPISTGIGLHCGDLVMGILGDKYRLNGNVVSDTVNVAARLETLTSQCGIGVAASAAVVSRLDREHKQFCRRLTKVQVVGKSSAIDVFELFAGADAAEIRMKQSSRAEFEAAGKQFLRSQFARARAEFAEIHQKNPNDEAARWMADRAAVLERHGVPEGWSGADILSRK